MVTDQSDGSRQVVEHLASLGHRSVTFLAGPRAFLAGEQRWGMARPRWSPTTTSPAVGMLRRFTQRAGRVPEDVGVVGYGNIFGADFCSPPLTTLAGFIETAGSAAVDVLLRLLDRPGGTTAGQRIVFPSDLCVRGSTDPAPQPVP